LATFSPIILRETSGSNCTNFGNITGQSSVLNKFDVNFKFETKATKRHAMGVKNATKLWTFWPP